MYTKMPVSKETRRGCHCQELELQICVSHLMWVWILNSGPLYPLSCLSSPAFLLYNVGLFWLPEAGLLYLCSDEVLPLCGCLLGTIWAQPSALLLNLMLCDENQTSHRQWPLMGLLIKGYELRKQAEGEQGQVQLCSGCQVELPW